MLLSRGSRCYTVVQPLRCQRSVRVVVGHGFFLLHFLYVLYQWFRSLFVAASRLLHMVFFIHPLLLCVA